MAHSSWGAGFPNCQHNKIKGLVRADGLKLQLREELIPLFALLIDETERLGYDVRRFNAGGEIVTGGFNCRAIADTNTPSNHSWGLAIDINSDVNPRRTPLTTNLPQEIPQLWARFNFRWGGGFPTPDPMHFEYMGSTADVAGDTDRARRELGAGGTGPTPAGPPPFPGVVLKRGSSGEHVCRIQARLRELGFAIDNRPGCPFGPQTQAAVEEFQRRKGLDDDGKVGRLTWGALFA